MKTGAMQARRESEGKGRTARTFPNELVKESGFRVEETAPPPDGLQPLHAVYARRCLPVIRGLIERDRLKITGFYPGHRLLTISPDVIRSFDPEGRMFMNVNTPEDLRNLPSR